MFASLQLTPNYVINKLTGTADYNKNETGYGIGSGTAALVDTALDSIHHFDMRVDFDSNQITDGVLEVKTAGLVIWETDFSGSFSGNSVTLTGSNVRVGGLPLVSGVSNLGGVFTGAGAEKFVGAFEIYDSLLPVNKVQGVFEAER